MVLASAGRLRLRLVPGPGGGNHEEHTSHRRVSGYLLTCLQGLDAEGLGRGGKVSVFQPQLPGLLKPRVWLGLGDSEVSQISSHMSEGGIQVPPWVSAEGDSTL